MARHLEAGEALAHRHRLELLPMLRRRSFYGEGAARLAASHEDEIVPAIFSVSTSASLNN